MSGVVFLKDRELLDVTPVENIFIAQFMPQAPEIAVKVYLYGLMLLSSPRSADEDIAAALGCTDTDVRAAFAYWQSAGIIRIVGEEPLSVQYLNIKEALKKGMVDTSGAVYGEFVKRIQQVCGTRMITGAELKKMYDWLEVFGFEQDAAVEIVRHCLDKKGAKTSVSYMDAMARTLAGKGALTKDKVLESFADEELLASGAARILKRWNRRSLPTEDQIALYEKWTKAWGFDDEAIDAALTKMTSAERATFGYLDAILTEWHDKGMLDPKAIEDKLRREDRIVELARRAFAEAGLKSKPNTEQRLLFEEWNVEKCMSEELILYAAKLAGEDARPFFALKRMLGDWYEHGISSVDEAKRYRETNGVRNTRRKGGRHALNYMQGEVYSRDYLKSIGVSLGEEFYQHDEE